MSELADVRYLLAAWARWMMTAHGYPTRAAVDRIGDPVYDGGYSSAIPRGIQHSAALGRLRAGMQSAINAGLGRQVEAVRAWYLRSHGATTAQVAAALGVSERELRRRRIDAERYLATWMQ